jgi:exodeoxyribonuclease V alpha subunit
VSRSLLHERTRHQGADPLRRFRSAVWGIGFKTADTIAAAVGIARDSAERIKAGLAYTLSEAADEGHCYLPAPNLIAGAAKIVEVPAGLIAPCLDELAATEGVIRESVPGPAPAGTVPQVPSVYLPPFHAAERSLASALLRLLAVRGRPAGGVPRSGLGQGAGLAARPHRRAARVRAEQAVRLALTSRMAVLTGGPGCGKSLTVRSVVALARPRAPGTRQGDRRTDGRCVIKKVIMSADRYLCRKPTRRLRHPRQDDGMDSCGRCHGAGEG